MAGHLELPQITSRLWRLAKRRTLALRPQHYHRHYHRPLPVTVSADLDAFVKVSETFASRRHSDHWLQDAAAGRFTFLNQTRELDLGGPDFWHPAETADLWELNLHYFDYAPCLAHRALGLLTEDPRQARVLTELLAGLVLDWMEKNKLGCNWRAWDSYAISSRSLNWMITYALLAQGPPQLRSWLPGGFGEAMSTSLAAQLRFLADNLEYDLRGNHLLHNAIALLCGSQFFQGRVARQWRQRGRKVLNSQLDEQILADGAHYELSPMYHCLVLQDVLTLAIVCGPNFARPLLTTPLAIPASRMLSFLEAISHPDGEIPLFNDSVLGVAPPISELRKIATQTFHHLEPTVPSAKQMVAASGYWPVRSDTDLLIADCGPPADARCAGHSHCDMLSFELSVGGQRIVVDSGVYEYTPGQMRDYCRSTAAHNTIVVDEHEQSELWDSFRIGRRARVLSCDVGDDPQPRSLTGLIENYDGYFRHQRTFVVQPGNWLVWDQISSPRARQAYSVIHLHPEVELTPADGFTFQLQRGDTQLWLYCLGADSVEVVEGWYCPEFYRRQRTQVLCLHRSLESSGGAWGYLICRSQSTDVELAHTPTMSVVSWGKSKIEIPVIQPRRHY